MDSQRISLASTRHPDALAGQAKTTRKVVGDPKELERELTSSVSPRVAGQAYLPREASVCPLRARKDYVRCGGGNSNGRQQIHLDSLIS